MADDDKMKFEVEVTGDAEVKFRKITLAAEELGEKGSKSASKFGDAMNVALGVVSGEAILGAIKGVASAASELFQTMVTDGVKAAQEQQNANNDLNIALAATGQYSATASERLIEYAGALEQTTKFQSSAIVQSQALIQQLGRLDEQGLKRATDATVNLAAALNIDLETAARMVGKAAAGEVASFNKFGIAIEEGRTKSETFSNALDVLERKFSGAASAQLNTFSGATTQAGNALDDISKALGTVIINNESLVSAIRISGEIFRELEASVKANESVIQQYISSGVLVAIDAMSLLVTVGQTVVISAYEIARGFVYAQGVLSAFTDAVTFGMTEAGARAQQSAAEFENFSQKIATLESGQTIADKIQDGLERMRVAAEAGFGATISGAQRSTDAASGAAAAIDQLSDAQKKLGEQGQKLAEDILAKADPQVEFEERQLLLEEALNQEKITHQEFADALVAITAERNKKLGDMQTERVDNLIAQNQLLMQDNVFANSKEIAENRKKMTALMNDENISARDRLKIQQQFANQSKAIEQARFQAITSTLSQLSQFQNSENKAMAVVGKTAAIAQTSIDTYRGATAAAAALAGIPIVGPGLAAAAATAFIAAGLANVAKISGVALKDGMTEVPAGYPNDTFPARLSSGERVTDAGTNQDLKGMIGEFHTLTAMMGMLLERIDKLESHTTVIIGQKTIVDEVREAQEAGRTIYG